MASTYVLLRNINYQIVNMERTKKKTKKIVIGCGRDFKTFPQKIMMVHILVIFVLIKKPCVCSTIGRHANSTLTHSNGSSTNSLKRSLTLCGLVCDVRNKTFLPVSSGRPILTDIDYRIKSDYKIYRGSSPVVKKSS